MTPRKTLTLVSLSFLLLIGAHAKTFTATVVPPNPVLMFTGREFYSANGKEWTRYKYSVDNRSAYPDDMFAAAPTLPPCGANTKSSRTWVDIYDSVGKRLYGFCALGKASDLENLWFALENDAVPPSWVYIEFTDRQTNTKYKSNLAETME